jgi:hypothetical protein
MKEEFLHYLWRLRRFNQKDLKTVEGLPIEILSVGTHNHDSGPDFLDARIKIGDTLWAGNVEIHINATDWNAHAHQKDPAYENVILHVVYEEDQPVYYKNRERIPCFELRKRIDSRVFKMYEKLQHNEYWIPCQHQFHNAPEITKKLWMDRLLVERLEQRCEKISVLLKANKHNWEETFYQCLASGFGLKVNTEPFEQLGRALPLLTLLKHKSQLFQIEALLFGQAGFLAFDFKEEYPNKLKKEFAFLQEKYELKPMAAFSWKFLRMRPANFPSIRIAQFAMLIFQSTHLFSKILAASDIAEIENALAVKVSPYWESHYVFDKEAKQKRKKSLGKRTIHLLIINIIAPIIFLYGKEKANDKYKDKAFQLLESLKPETNKIINKWGELGLKPDSAYQTQALLQLKNKHCDAQKCLSCPIGNAILNKSNPTPSKS